MSFTNYDDAIVLSVPHRGEPTTWVAYGRDDFVKAVYRGIDGRDSLIEDMTVAEMLATAGLDGSEDPAEFREPDFELTALQMAAKYPRSQRLYRRGDWHMSGTESWGAEPLDEFEAACEYEAHDVSAWYLVTAEECAALLARLTGPDAPRMGQCGHIAAARALRREAIRLGWIDDSEG